MNTFAKAMLVGVLSVIWLTGCVVFPSSSEVAPACRGIVRDARTELPIAGAVVTAKPAGFQASALSKGDGSFQIPRLRQCHYIVYIGDPGHYPTPWWVDQNPWQPYEISVKADDYQPTNLSIAPKTNDLQFIHFPNVIKLDLNPISR
jgi:hypothetical protein